MCEIEYLESLERHRHLCTSLVAVARPCCCCFLGMRERPFFLLLLYLKVFLAGAHVDAVYMGRGTSNLLTIWTPFGENPLEMGALAVVESSNKLQRLQHFQVNKTENFGS